MGRTLTPGGGLVSGQYRFLCPECQTIQPLEGRKRRTDFAAGSVQPSVARRTC